MVTGDYDVTMDVLNTQRAVKLLRDIRRGEAGAAGSAESGGGESDKRGGAADHASGMARGGGQPIPGICS